MRSIERRGAVGWGRAVGSMVITAVSFAAVLLNPALPTPALAQEFVRGNANGDPINFVDLADVSAIWAYLLEGTPTPAPPDRLDVNDNGVVEVSDASYLLRFLFASGDSPPAPYPLPGEDTTAATFDATPSADVTVTVGDVATAPGQVVDVPIRVDSTLLVEALVVAIDYAPLVVIGAELSPSPAAPVDLDVVEVSLDPANSRAYLLVHVDFLMADTLPVGDAEIALLSLQIAYDQPAGTTTLALESVLDRDPPLYNVVSVDDDGVAVTEVDGSLEVEAAPFVDCNDNGVDDLLDIASGTSVDGDRNAIPDECDIATDPTLDCDGDGALDDGAFAFRRRSEGSATDDGYGPGVAFYSSRFFTAAPDAGGGTLFVDSLSLTSIGLRWQREAFLDGANTLVPSPGDRLGAALDGGSRALIAGAPGRDGVEEDEGVAYAIRRAFAPGGFAWIVDALSPSDSLGGDAFGGAVATFGEIAVVAATERAVDGAVGAGRVTVFEFDVTTAEWSEAAHLTAADAGRTPTIDDRFGTTLTFDGEFLFVAIPGADAGVGGATVGEVLVFRADAADDWSFVQTLTPASPVDGARFGAAIVRGGDRVAIGAPGEGAVEIHRRATDGLSWEFEATIVDADPLSGFGEAIAFDAAGTSLIVGAPAADSGAGQVVAHEYTFWGGWRATQRWGAFDSAPDRSYGVALRLAGGALAVGGTPGGEVGVVDFYDRSVLDCDDNGTPDRCDLVDTMLGSLATTDCNRDGRLDSCEFSLGEVEDCNENGIPDGCDIADGTSTDLNLNGVPDDCEPGVVTFRILDPVTQYDVATGVGTVSIELAIIEEPVSLDYPNSFTGFQLALSHDPDVLDPTAASAAPVLAALNDGSGPEFLSFCLDPQGMAGVAGGAVFSIGGEAQLSFETETVVLTVDYDTVPALLLDNVDGVDTPLVWDSTLACNGDTVVVNLAVSEGAESFVAALEDRLLHVDPNGRAFLRGDADGNGFVFALLDALFLLSFGFTGGPAPTCADAADADGNEVLFPLLDATYVLNYGLAGGPPPPAPGPDECGPDPEGDALDCADPGGC